MEEELAQLKSLLRSLVVSCPTRIDARSVLRDYRNMVGAPLPCSKFGYRDAIAFLRERFSDCFLGPSTNPELTLIVPSALKHVDKLVQKQRVPSTVKNKGKRRSVPEAAVSSGPNLIAKTFAPHSPATSTRYNYTNCTKPMEKITVNGHTTKHNYKHRATSEQSQECAEAGRDVGDDVDSGRLTSSSSSSSKRAALEELKLEVRELVLQSAAGVPCTDLMRLYRQRYGRELNFSRFGLTSVMSLAGAVDGVALTQRADGDWLLSDAARAPPAAAPRRAPSRALSRAASADHEDALPGIDYAPEVFPEDCLHMLESIPAADAGDVRAGETLEVVVGEVYSPSHFWLQRLGEQHNIAMENIMDEMNRYYFHGAGRTRRLLPGAVRVGYYCSSCYDGDWHRSLIVKVLDDDTVKVRHVDYGTVERVPVGGLRPLRREWAALPAQALRARLAGVRPPAANRRWPRSSAHHFLGLVCDRRLIASVTAVDAQEDALEVLLIDTATSEDRCIASELVRSRHADPRDGPALGVTSSLASPPASDESLLGTPSGSEDAASDVSASASQLVGSAPRPMHTWACPSDSESADDESAVTAATAATADTATTAATVGSLSSAMLACKLRALHARLRAPTELAPTELASTELASTELASTTSECYLFPHFAVLESGATPNFAEISTYIRDGIVLDCLEEYRAHVPAALPSAAPPPAPSPSPSPPPPPSPPRRASLGAALQRARSRAAYERAPLVTLTREQVHLYWRLSRMAPGPAHVFMLHALDGALGADADAADRAASAACMSRLNPHAPEFRSLHTPY